jgi:glycosyltransferase involved in cell wall biosynthesis
VPRLITKTSSVSAFKRQAFPSRPQIHPLQGAGTRPFWSVMIPTYNPRLDYLEETLRSVLQQDPGAGEMQIEVVDDCSPDGAPVELVRHLAGDRIAVHVELKNNGLAGVWNRCIERARGHWVHILHQDDLVFPGFYQALKESIERHPEAGAAYTRHAYCDENGHWHRLAPLERSSPGLLPDLLELLATEEHIQCASIAVKRCTYEQIGGFTPDLKHALDWEMWIRIASAFPVLYEPRILACWRNHSEATTSKQMRSGENVQDIAKAIRIWSSYVDPERAARMVPRARRYAGRCGLWLARHFLRLKDFQACQKQMCAALHCSCDPKLLVRLGFLLAQFALIRGLTWRRSTVQTQALTA